MNEVVKKPFYKRWWFIILAVIVVLGIIGNLADKDLKEERLMLSEGTEMPEEQKIKKNTNPSPPEISEEQKQINLLEREIKSIKDGIDYSRYRGEIQTLQIEIAMFMTWSKFVNEAKSSINKEIKKLGDKLSKLLSREMKKELPVLRKEYAQIVKKRLWEQNINVNISGRKSNILEFEGSLFSLNKNIKDFHNTLSTIFIEFRFKEVKYKVYNGQSEYTYYEPFKGKDTDLYQ